MSSMGRKKKKTPLQPGTWVRLTPEQHEGLRLWAEKHWLGTSDVLRLCVRDLLSGAYSPKP